MADINTWRVACQDAGDGSGDAIIELPSELLERLGWVVGDELILERVESVLSLKLKPLPSEPTG
ncbi:AbrB/MazE/SpoVT family DNA-binding domain-containing protein [Pseudomonas schmalbachii]|uniref:AbrB/MazE/SpoVT family DNA-binding domain-containing protein n=1 Tax=Pseudomonas schmalbachii TaxID=2816993 RepID=A0ABS3TK01_9PSED|nr:AbrB/MazE/SpoVT family DNA-binding domain-containing protein [Pseudomonas schmalbachii]MBO3273987.1 AbrB/MazE/SpoVT family DNA-binding domain-containing protein [Pseudomonas schmalbachii]